MFDEGKNLLSANMSVLCRHFALWNLQAQLMQQPQIATLLSALLYTCTRTITWQSQPSVIPWLFATLFTSDVFEVTVRLTGTTWASMQAMYGSTTEISNERILSVTAYNARFECIVLDKLHSQTFANSVSQTHFYWDCGRATSMELFLTWFGLWWGENLRPKQKALLRPAAGLSAT